MTTYLFYAVIVLAVVLLIAKVPGLQLLFLPVVWVIAESGKGVITFILYWLLYVVKLILRSHKDFVMHFFADEEEYDVELLIKRRERE